MTCPACNGKGYCYSCGGTGDELTGYDDEGEYYVDCDECSGSGDCPNCDGTGEVE